ncbi:MAG: hypothetical protein Q9220_003418 [cf. Caloplaca sp. 1 TL-2023]
MLEAEGEQKIYNSAQGLPIPLYLAPSQENEALPPVGQKRKYHQVSSAQSTWEAFEVKLCRNNLGFETAVYTPRLLLPRRCLPLAFLDTSGAGKADHESKIFNANIPALENDFSDDTLPRFPHLLIADRSGKSLCAIEHVRPGLYAQCRLDNWVTLEHLNDLPRSKTFDAVPSKRPCLQDRDQWWQGIVTEKKELPRLKAEAAPHCTRNSLDLRKPTYSSGKGVSSVNEVNRARSIEGTAAHLESQPPEVNPQISLDEPLVDPNELLDTIKTQYMDSLYISGASLAYFAKGPLSRARAAFSRVDDTPISRRRLVEYLRTLVVPLNILDKKYRETLPTLFPQFPDFTLSEEERDEAILKYQKSIPKSKKGKIRKDGLYPGEEAIVLRWWLSQVADAPASESLASRSEVVQNMVLEQRSRETHLQLILMLEVLALEALSPVPSIEEIFDERHEKGEAIQKQRKSKKQPDLNLLLDLTIDRLCIWQSMSVEIDDASKKMGEKKHLHNDGRSGKKQGVDLLRGFCIDVVLPFYAARLPEASKTVCQKLGGPVPNSPARPLLKRASSTMKPPKPGATLHKPPPQQVRRTLERVLTDEKTGRRRPPMLSRSATDSVLPTLKREPSETSLSTIPSKKTTLHKSHRYNQREVDLTAVSQAVEVKMKKKADLEQEIESAIATLKRPNPRMAVKELVEASDRRATGAKSRKSTKPVWNPSARGVQVMATPTANRRRNVLPGKVPQLQALSILDEDSATIPPSSCTHVPASTTKQSVDVPMGVGENLPRKRVAPTIEQTPTRGPSKHSQSILRTQSSSAFDEAGVPMVPASTLKAKHPPSFLNTNRNNTDQLPSMTFDVQQTPSRRVSVGTKDSLSRVRVESTPTKTLRSISGNAIGPTTNITSSPGFHEGGISIYKSLGWDDDFDELM